MKQNLPSKTYLISSYSTPSLVFFIAELLESVVYNHWFHLLTLIFYSTHTTHQFLHQNCSLVIISDFHDSKFKGNFLVLIFLAFQLHLRLLTVTLASVT